MEKLLAALDVFRKGSSVANATAWKQHQVTATMLAVLIVALVRLAKALGYDVPIDEDTATAIGGGIIAVVNVLLTYATTDKVGLLPARTVAAVTAEPMDTTSKPDEASQPVVPADPTLPLIPQNYIEEARAAAVKDRANLYNGA